MIGLKKIEVPYPIPPAFSEDIRERHMAWAVAQGYPRLRGRMMTHDRLQIVAYGPSLADTWREINPEEPLITMSGALKFLLERGLKPVYGKWFHTDVDPRPHKIAALARHKDVVYMIGSCAHPELFKHLEGYKVVLYHALSGGHTFAWVQQNDPDQILIAAGSTIGLTAIHLGGIMGYYHFEVFGMDGGFKGAERHAGPHFGVVHGQIESKWNPGWKTSRLMDNTNFEIEAMLKNFPIFCVFHGEGLVQDWVGKAGLKSAARHGTPEADFLRAARYKCISLDEATELHKRGLRLDGVWTSRS